MDTPHVLLSLGAGVQSTTLALMAARGELPRPEAAIFADTGWESPATYAHLAWLTAELAGVLPIHVVRKTYPDGTTANIRDDVIGVARGARARAATPPAYVKQSEQFNPSPLPAVQARFARHAGGRASFVVMPLFARDFTGRVSPLRRQCTGEYKIEPIVRKARELIGRRRGARTGPTCEMWIGISADEKPSRCRDAGVGWITNAYPLRTLGLTRPDCEAWLREHYRLQVPKSSCTGCPYHSNAFWRDMQRNRPEEWADAVAFDREIRRLPMVQGEVYLHRSCLPLDQVDLRTPEERGQLTLFDTPAA
jgi:hypothetical protein